MAEIRERHLKILEALAVYKYLTVTQFIEIGVKKHKQNINETLKEMRETKKPLIGFVKLGLLPGVGKLPYVYYLEKKGVEVLIDYLNLTLKQINYPVGKATIFSRDYFHRVYCIDFQIALRKWANKKVDSVEFYYNYYDKIGSNRKIGGEKSRTLTRIDIDKEKYIIPDSIFKISKNNANAIYLFEQHNGKDTKKFLKQFLNHALVIKKHLVKKIYGTKNDHRVCCVFEEPTIMEAVKRRLQEEHVIYELFKDYFLFKTNDMVKEMFFNGWQTYDGRKITLFGKADEQPS